MDGYLPPQYRSDVLGPKIERYLRQVANDDAVQPPRVVQPFALRRTEDESGVSGTGIVAVGVVWPSGRVSLEWLAPVRGMNFYESLEECMLVHGHRGKTQIVLL